jgi:uncharacterized membrane protein YkoI
MKKPLRIALIAVAALAALGALGYFAYDRLDWHEHRERRAQSSTGTRLPLEEALQIAQREVPGEVIKVERDREHGIEAIEIKVLAVNGRVREITLDAHSGEVLEIEDD